MFHKETETFSHLWTAYSEDYALFCRRYEDDAARYGRVEAFVAKPNPPKNSFTVSMLPGVSFEGFHLHTPDFRYLIPIFTLGKFTVEHGRTLLPMAVQVHHVVCDGFHVSRFISELQDSINLL